MAAVVNNHLFRSNHSSNLHVYKLTSVVRPRNAVGKSGYTIACNLKGYTW